MPLNIPQTFKSHGLDVSHETIQKLETYDALLRKWQKAINLVGPTTIEDSAERHFYDSAQLLKYIPDLNIRLADMGTGAGFPGLVLAILGVKDVHLIESDVRKATFLREVSRETQTPVTIHDIRVEDCRVEGVDVFTARALAPLKDLLDHMERLMTSSSACGLFLKGNRYEEELEKARKKWQFSAEAYPSETEAGGKILKVTRLICKPCGM